MPTITVSATTTVLLAVTASVPTGVRNRHGNPNLHIDPVGGLVDACLGEFVVKIRVRGADGQDLHRQRRPGAGKKLRQNQAAQGQSHLVDIQLQQHGIDDRENLGFETVDLVDIGFQRGNRAVIVLFQVDNRVIVNVVAAKLRLHGLIDDIGRLVGNNGLGQLLNQGSHGEPEKQQTRGQQQQQTRGQHSPPMAAQAHGPTPLRAVYAPEPRHSIGSAAA